MQAEPRAKASTYDINKTFHIFTRKTCLIVLFHLYEAESFGSAHRILSHSTSFQPFLSLLQQCLADLFFKMATFSISLSVRSFAISTKYVTNPVPLATPALLNDRRFTAALNEILVGDPFEPVNTENLVKTAVYKIGVKIVAPSSP